MSPIELALQLSNNVAYLLALTFIYGLLSPLLNRYQKSTQSIIRGVLFGLFGIVVMLNTIQVLPGYFLDGRSIVIVVAGMFGGSVPGLITALIVSLYRVTLGGGGVPPSMFSALTCALVGIWIYHQSQTGRIRIALNLLVFLGVFLVIQHEFWTLLFAGTSGGEYLQRTLLPALIIYPIGTVLLGLLLLRHERHERIEAALHESEERYRLIVTTMNEGIAIISTEGKIISCNPSAERILGFDASQLVGNSLFDPRWIVMREDGSPFSSDAFPAVMTIRTGAPQFNSVMGVKKFDGNVVWIEVSTYPLMLSEGGTPTAVFATFTDVTERRQSQEKLRQERDLLRTLIDSTNDYIFIKDAEGRFVLSNIAHAQAGNLHPADLVGKTAFDIFPQALADQYHADDQHIMASGQPLINVERTTVGPDGQPRTVLTSKIPLHEAGGKITGLVGISRDITDRKQYETQSLELAAERERVNVLQRFITDMSHDFRTPLSIISSSLYLIKKSPDPEKQRIHLDKLEQQALRINTLLDGVLQMSNLDRHDVKFQFQDTDLNTLIERVVEDFEPTANDAQLALVFQPDTAPCIAQVDQVEVSRAVIKLLENAIAYTDAGGSITLRTHIEDDLAVIAVQDTGIGIAGRDLPHIFERFYRADQARSTATGGNGLGLSIVQNVLDAHGGGIDVESIVGQGSTFTIKLPVKQYITADETDES